MTTTPETKQESVQPRRVAQNLWTMEYSLSVLGNEHGRIVTIIRLNCGKLIIHSTAPFSREDVAAISDFGEPGWLVDANMLHDTFAKQGREAFPNIPYLAPAGFAEGSNIEISTIMPAPTEWQDEIKVTLVEGMPLVREYAFLHIPSRTLIVGDLVNNFDERESAYGWFMHHAAMGLHGHPALNRLVAAMVEDKALFAACIGFVMTWDFDRLIVGHNRMIDSGAKAALKAALERAFPDLKL